MKLLVYGTLKNGFSNHNILKNSTFIAEAATKELYQMFGEGVPVIKPLRVERFRNTFDEKMLSTFHRVKGELYKIDEETLRRCDILEGHPTGYTRHVIDVVRLDNGELDRAFVYEMLRPWGRDNFCYLNEDSQYEFRALRPRLH